MVLVHKVEIRAAGVVEFERDAAQAENFGHDDSLGCGLTRRAANLQSRADVTDVHDCVVFTEDYVCY
jgi:hypothetical protein